MSSHPTSRATHAVVIGAGPTGRAAALALAARTERVTLVDRADVPGPEWEARPRAADVRAILESPQVVVRAGLEVVGLVVADDADDADDAGTAPVAGPRTVASLGSAGCWSVRVGPPAPRSPSSRPTW